MSVLRKKPYIETVLDNLTSEDLTSFKELIDNENVTPLELSLIPGKYNFIRSWSKEKAVTLVTIQLSDISTKTGYLVWDNDDNISLITFHKFNDETYDRYQDLKVYKINELTLKVEKLREYYTISDLRSYLNILLKIDQKLQALGNAEGESY